jgi:hypothetical protein
VDFPQNETLRYDGALHPLVAQLPHYRLVPKDRTENKAWRIRMLRRAARDKAFQQSLMKACAEDFLFFVNAFCFILEPREGEQIKGLAPFVTWAHQDPVLAAMAHYIGVRHIVCDKSRAQGASWMLIVFFVWLFLFRPHSVIGMGSKDEETADSPSNPDSLGWKVDFIMRHLPAWMRPPGILVNEPNRKLSDHTWTNVLNGSTLKAYSATAGIGRAGRFTVFGLDESAFYLPGKDTEAVSNLLKTTNSLMMFSTPNGVNNEHHTRVTNPGRWLLAILDWKDNPWQRRGLYTVENGQLVFLDKEYVHADNYKFVLDGRVRSPWYDARCEDDNNNMLLIGQELDREHTGSKGRPFPAVALEAAKEFCVDPLHIGMLSYEKNEPHNADSHVWIEGEGYNFRLWQPLDQYGRLPEGRYVIGADIGAGTAGDTSSNSVLEIFDSQGREQVGELALNTMPPTEFGALAVAVCYWLGRGAQSVYLAWEKNGPGGTAFTKEVMRLNYSNVLYEQSGSELADYRPTTNRPGYHTRDTYTTLEPLISALFSGDVSLRSHLLIEECGQYVFNDSGKVEHPKAKTTRDSSARGPSHGDRAIAAAIAMRALGDRPPTPPPSSPEEAWQQLEAEEYSFAWRMGQRAERREMQAVANGRW